MNNSEDAQTLVRRYFTAVRSTFLLGNATEPSYYPHLNTLLEGLDSSISATTNPKRIKCGAPDFSISRSTAHGLVTSGYIEAKEPGASLKEIEATKQLIRYRGSIPNLILTDFLTFRWYIGGELRSEVRLGWLDAQGHFRGTTGKEWARVAETIRAFISHAPEPIADPQQLATHLARITHLIRDVVVQSLERGEASDMLCDLQLAFGQTLLPNQSTLEFSNMFAQTLTYGLFAARCNHSAPTPFKRQDAATEIPKTNPFLRRLFGAIAGPDLDDEPFAGYVDDLTQLLSTTDMGTVLADFGRRRSGEDPVIHFYETFLAAYDANLRKVRGVYYTPNQVVSYMVKAVDHLLKGSFGCPAGLADTTRTDDGQPRVFVLDPACGTGAFLYAIVEHIRNSFKQQGTTGMWSAFVRDHLLPKLLGFELLMGAYAVAHFKLGMQLAAQDLPSSERDEWAYDFSTGDRLGVFLTNTLEEAVGHSDLLMARYISEEANAAASVKRQLPIMVVLGNPPYAGHSANAGKRRERTGGPRSKQRMSWVPTWIGKLIQDYYEVDGKPLGERNPKWLQDDYVKFLRFGQWRINRTGAGMMAYITNHGYLDNSTFRGMRQQLMDAFTEIYVLDLHGNAKKRERAPDGSIDANVFDIQQGVSIGIFVKRPEASGPATVRHSEVWGDRQSKYDWLDQTAFADTNWETLDPKPPHYLFVPQDTRLRAEYEEGFKLTDAMPLNSVGIATHRDRLAYDIDEQALRARISEFIDPLRDDGEVRDSYLSPKDKLSVANARTVLRNDSEHSRSIVRCLYRPFDVRHLFYHDAVIERSRRQVMRHMLSPNLALGVGKQGQAVDSHNWQVVTCSESVVDLNLFRRGGVNLFPLYLEPICDVLTAVGNGNYLQEQMNTASKSERRQPNFSPAFWKEACNRLNGVWMVAGVPEYQPSQSSRSFAITPEDLFNYIYALLHAPSFRRRFSEFLRIDFPRIPLTRDRALFRALSSKGSELIDLHLLSSPSLANNEIQFPIRGEGTVQKAYPHYLAPGERDPLTDDPVIAGRVYINGDAPESEIGGQYFGGVPPEVWKMQIGGYQVCYQWLKARRGRSLTFDDIEHYRRMIAALQQTISLMHEIDQSIRDWPLA